MGRTVPFHLTCNANCSGALVLFTAKRSMIDLVLEVVYLMDFCFSLLKSCALWTAEHSLPMWSYPISICILYATELHWCWFIIGCYFCFTHSFEADLFDLLCYLIYFLIYIHSLVCWRQWMDKLVFMSCVYVQQCWETNECVWLLMMQINKTSGAYCLYIPSVKSDINKHFVWN